MLDEIRAAAPGIAAPHPIVAHSPAMRTVLSLIGRVASKQIDVLLLGESGTGKELVAKALHLSSERKQKPFVALNVAAIAQELIESELFGSEKGAYTGAHESRPGKFELAKDGTLFLDEIGEMSLEMQTKLLRVLQEREFERVGSHAPIAFTARIVAATNKDLERAVNERRFREDLFYRLNVFPVHVPPLRERHEDIPVLARTFAAEEGKALRGFALELSDAAIALLAEHPWPGNVRELKNTISRAVILTAKHTLDQEDLAPLLRERPKEHGAARASDKVTEEQPLLAPPDFMTMPLEELVMKRLQPFVAKFCEGPTGDLYKLVEAQMERALFRLVLDRTRGNQLRAAEILGLNRNTLRKKLRELGLERK
ncbi:MAG: sigma-54-dependent Fis family transcriptional regulator [Deltaproteobacteria bacterium]|nr:sigma-54-dependent Fis family transcriptional regulator [Deltaproteobacteria bacterium]